MSKKKNAQYWYQVHKARSGHASVESSREVADARAKVHELESQVTQLRSASSDGLLSGIRRLFFGRNAQEERSSEAEKELSSARLDMDQKVRAARRTGERAYSSEWASKNPSKVK